MSAIPRFFVLLLFLVSACQPQASPWPLQLAEITESRVTVSIRLERSSDGQYFLAATFTPAEEGLALYGKDVPREGVAGLGRPTLLELTAQSKMQAAGELIESVPAELKSQGEGSPELLVYPAGAVTLRLPVTLPAGDAEFIPDEVSITFMACQGNRCLKPVEGRIVPVEVPTHGAVE